MSDMEPTIIAYIAIFGVVAGISDYTIVGSCKCRFIPVETEGAEPESICKGKC